MTAIKDKILYFKLKQKDQKAFVEAYDLYIDDIYRFIFFKVGNKEEAEDLTSSVFLKVWNHIQNNGISNFKTLKALFYQVARNLVIDFYRKKNNKRDVSYSASDSMDFVDEKQDIVGQIELTGDIEEMEKKMSELKDEYREVLVLRYVNELSVIEIADVLDKNKGNVRVLIHRALKALKDISNT